MYSFFAVKNEKGFEALGPKGFGYLYYASNRNLASKPAAKIHFFFRIKKLFRIKNIKNLLLSKNICNFVNDKASNPISNHEKVIFVEFPHDAGA